MATPLRASILPRLNPRRIKRHVDTSPIIIQKGCVKVAIPRYVLKDRGLLIDIVHRWDFVVGHYTYKTNGLLGHCGHTILIPIQYWQDLLPFVGSLYIPPSWSVKQSAISVILVGLILLLVLGVLYSNLKMNRLASVTTWSFWVTVRAIICVSTYNKISPSKETKVANAICSQRYDDLLQADQAIERETDLDADRGSSSGAEIAASEGTIREPSEGTNHSKEGHSNISNALRDKPAGQPNWPNSGGYSLEETLLGDGNWTKENFQKLMAHGGQVPTIKTVPGMLASDRYAQDLLENNFHVSSSRNSEDGHLDVASSE
ncbi:hypothetical protein ARMGADRAFT_1037806 [Armillaria gallica]|uniref:Uncharacterized protein n=1 Tax=Armillaria gallica TaxID=47427 RepID=A0A2H3CWS2_ARMGA|nr:hypothetical protein ARMGADRAFT_1037806 [Armillaria gallica]